MRRVAALVIAAALVLPATPAMASSSSSDVTWTVQPATATGPDGRRWVERTLDPGQVVTEHLAVRNFSSSPVSFALTAADGYLTGKGRFNMLPSSSPSTDGGTWIAVQDAVTVGAGETAVVPFTITVPANATPGDHPAGIAASVAGDRGTVQVESRVGFRVLLRASGTVQPALSVDDVSAVYSRSWNPLKPGALTVSYAVANTGNIRLSVADRVRASELFGLSSASAPGSVAVSGAAAAPGDILPGGTRTGTARVEGVWGLGRVRTTIDLTSDASASVTVTTWVVPWPQLFLALGVVALLLAVRAAGRLRRRRLDALLAQARLEGARSAS
ncbi:hypothetical protein ACTI_72660 [Actinoplanes sp. OR16]|uniref:hypothetical protein n=1 Tax=Actinoplanes sp. OR16 TaxID=946334 RepID=UPI000F7166B5|nr:hypothetical protein [Actinoplanes sp. OR16]BBH70581.1 hypothetical protein ACTI_72660 [Actinoplanes sp. OR16]